MRVTAQVLREKARGLSLPSNPNAQGRRVATTLPPLRQPDCHSSSFPWSPSTPKTRNAFSHFPYLQTTYRTLKQHSIGDAHLRRSRWYCQTLKLRRYQESYTNTEPPPFYLNPCTGTTAGVTQGAHRAVLDWSTGVIAKLAAALPKSTAPAVSPATGAAAAASPGGDSVGERHARNARRWLSDPRIWRAFVRSLRGGAAAAAADPSTHLPQAAGLGVLRAAVFAVRGRAARAGLEGVRAAEVEGSIGESTVEEATARDWAFVAILTLCGGAIVTTAGGEGGQAGGAGDGARHTGGYSSGSLANINGGVLDELLPRRAEARTGASPSKWGMGGALMRTSLDTYVTFLEEVIRGHAVTSKAAGREDWSGAMAPAAVAVAGGGAPASLEEGTLTELLRFQVVLQAQQTSRRKVRLCIPIYPLACVLPFLFPIWASTRSSCRFTTRKFAFRVFSAQLKVEGRVPAPQTSKKKAYNPLAK